MHGFDPRQEIWELPLDAIKEALTNALCHRDYFDSGAKIMVQLYDDRLEISNPGGLLPYVAADFGHRSRSRNPLIFRMFTRLHLVESVGTGIPRIARILSEDGFPPAPKIFFRYYLVDSSTGVKSQTMLAECKWAPGA